MSHAICREFHTRQCNCTVCTTFRYHCHSAVDDPERIMSRCLIYTVHGECVACIRMCYLVKKRIYYLPDILVKCKNCMHNQERVHYQFAIPKPSWCLSLFLRYFINFMTETLLIGMHFKFHVLVIIVSLLS